MTEAMTEQEFTPRRPKGRSRVFRIFQEIFLLLMIIGSFGTWEIFEVPVSHSSRVVHVEFSGTSPLGNNIGGWLTFTFAVLILLTFVMNVLMDIKATAGFTTALFLAAAVVSGNAAFPIWSEPDHALVSGTVGWGLWMTFLAAIVGMLMGFVWMIRTGQIGSKNPDYS